MNLFVDKSDLPDGVPWVALLYPSWGPPEDWFGLPDTSVYARLCEQGVPGILQTEWASASHVLLPFDWRYTESHPQCREIADRLARKCAASGKTLIVFNWSDDSAPIDLPGAVVFRTSLDKSPRYHVTEFAMPAWLEDPADVATSALPTTQDPRSVPAVGFCGFTHQQRRVSASRQLLKRALRGLFRAGTWTPQRLRLTPLELRQSVLEALRRSPLVRTDFIERDSFFAGAVSVATGVWDPAIKARVRREYVENILGTQYTVCVRGAGNYSHRYFDTLACGRLPLVVDTGGGIPYDFKVDWTRRGPWLPVKDVQQAARYVDRFHRSFAADELAALAAENRAMYLEYLSPEGFFKHFTSHFS